MDRGYQTKGVLIENTIILESPLNLPEQTKVQVDIVPIKKNIMKAYGLWKGKNNLPGLVKEIYSARKKNRGRAGKE